MFNKKIAKKTKKIKVLKSLWKKQNRKMKDVNHDYDNLVNHVENILEDDKKKHRQLEKWVDDVELSLKNISNLDKNIRNLLAQKSVERNKIYRKLTQIENVNRVLN